MTYVELCEEIKKSSRMINLPQEWVDEVLFGIMAGNLESKISKILKKERKRDNFLFS